MWASCPVRCSAVPGDRDGRCGHCLWAATTIEPDHSVTRSTATARSARSASLGTTGPSPWSRWSGRSFLLSVWLGHPCPSRREQTEAGAPKGFRCGDWRHSIENRHPPTRRAPDHPRAGGLEAHRTGVGTGTAPLRAPGPLENGSSWGHGARTSALDNSLSALEARPRRPQGGEGDLRRMWVRLGPRRRDRRTASRGGRR
jgi:hypothetical protein